MTGENRVLAHFGLQVINSNPRPGIKALIHQIKEGTRYNRCCLYHCALNQCRWTHKTWNHAVELLTEFDFEQAQQFALRNRTI
jgi:single-stranded-DNA-specific exonuclease